MAEPEDEFWALSKHAVARWNQRVSDGNPYAEIEEFLQEASLRRRPPRWITNQMSRNRRQRSEPVSFAVSPAWPGVCLVVDRSSRVVITTIVKKLEDE